GHLLVLEDLARILALTGRTVSTVTDRHTVRCMHAPEAPALHRALKALALGVARNVHHLPGDEVLCADGGADREQGLLALDAELRDLLLQRHLRLGEMLALRFRDVLLLGLARAHLERDVTVAIRSAMRNDLAIFERQDGDRHMAAVLLEQAGHPDFLCDHARAHDQTPSTEAYRTIRQACQPNCRASPRPG